MPVGCSASAYIASAIALRGKKTTKRVSYNISETVQNTGMVATDRRVCNKKS